MAQSRGDRVCAFLQVGPWTRMRRSTQEGTPMDQVPVKQRTAKALAAAQAASIGRVHMLAAS